MAAADRLRALPARPDPEPEGHDLPAISLSLPFAAIMMRNTRCAVLEAINQDYVQVARAKGLQDRVVLGATC